MAAVRVLIVDDVEEVRRDLRTVLTLAGNIEIVGEASDGFGAIRLTESLNPDAILMDLEMPVLDGFEATRQIKTRWPSCRVIALTVHDYESARQRAFRAGVDDFIVKGAPLENVMRVICSTTERKES